MKEFFDNIFSINILQNELLNIPNWQWLTFVLILALGYFVSGILALIVIKGLQLFVKRVNIQLDESELIQTLTKPINLIFLGWSWFIGLSLVGISSEKIHILSLAAKILTIYGFLLAGLKLIDIISSVLLKKASKTDSKIDDLLIPLVSRSLKSVVILLSLLTGAEIFELPITSLLAGLGIGGLAIAMAAKDTISNIFGSLTIVTDRPFHIGDWVQIGEHEGMVEKLGFRSTRIRTFYNSLVTIPNSLLLTETVDNYGERQYRRIKTMLSLTYDTPTEKIEAFCEEVRQIIKKHPFTRKDYYQVYFNAFSGSSLDVLLYCFLDTPDWAKELEQRHDLFLSIINAAKKVGVEFAYPTQTLFVKQDQA